MKQIYEKYLIEELDSKTKRAVLNFIAEPPVKKIGKIKVNGMDVAVDNATWRTKKDYDLYFEYNKDLIELTKFLTDTVDDMKDKKFEAKERGTHMLFHITNK
jgi:hypothetical protein